MECLNLCRLCSEEKHNLVSLFDNDGSKYLKCLTQIELKIDDFLPTKSCAICWDNLLRAHNIQQSFLDADKIIREKINKAKIIAKESLNTKENFTARTENYTSKRSLKREKINIFECIICSTQFNNFKESTEHHFNQHFIDQHCKFCNTYFGNVKDYDIHLEKDHGNIKKSRTCSECKVSFLCTTFLDSHKDNVHKNTESRHLKKCVGNKSKKELKACQMCGKKYKSDKTLKNHVKNIHESLKITKQYSKENEDSTCSLVKNEENLSEQHKNTDEFSCEMCGISYKNDFMLKNHLKLIHNRHDTENSKQYSLRNKNRKYEDNNYKSNNISLNEGDLLKQPKIQKDTLYCTDCNKTFNTRKLYVCHILNHQKRKCPHCNISIGRYTFKFHLRTHTDGPQTCETCNQTLKNKRTLRNHINTVHKVNTCLLNTRQVCHLCGKNFKCKKSLESHFKYIHKILNDKESVKSDNAKYKCSECNKEFSDRPKYLAHVNNHRKRECAICHLKISRFNFMRHVKSHSDSTKICHLCGVTCKNSESLRGHLQYTHSTREFRCGFCERIFRKRYDRLLHEKKVHTGERNHVCDHCGQSFITLFLLKNHFRIHHSDSKPYTCSTCEKCFSNMKVLLQHERQHTNHNAYTCDLCLQSFQKKILLKEHKSSVHNAVESKTCRCKGCEKIYSSEYALKCHFDRCHRRDEASEGKECG